ncbi:unnamed protein product [Effrenium voratum]|nr:unnamed protein product [Effrenium voratum]
MEGFTEAVLLPGILALELGLLFKLIQLVVSFLQADKPSLGSMLACWKKGREQWNTITRQYLEKAAVGSEKELARMRCTWTRRAWWVLLAINMPRLLLRQVWRSHGDQTREEFDLGLLWVCTMGLVIAWCPQLINSCSQDVLYMMAVLGMDAAVLMSGLSHSIDVMFMITFSFPGRFMYAVLAKRASCVVFCITAHFLQAIHLSVARHAQDSQAAGSDVTIPDLLAVFLAMFWGILAVRRLLLENVLLRVDVQKRTVEMGAVSSLLTACYDAVLEVDQGLRLAHDSPQLSSMLLRAQRAGGLSGAVLLDFFCEGDRARVSDHFRSSTGQSAVALNADMLDSDFNRVKVELICVQFDNLTNDRNFLVGVREMQDLERGPLTAPLHPATFEGGEDLERGPVTAQSHPATFRGDEDLFVVFDVYSLELHIMSDEMQRLCQQLLPVGGNMPEHILDIASPDTRVTLTKQLQLMANEFAEREQQQKEADQEVATVTFNLLGLGERRATVTIEHDQVLECWVACLVIPKATLTESNLRSLPETQPLHGPDHGHFLEMSSSWSQRSKSHRSSRSRHSSRSSRSGRIRLRTDRSGSISQLHVTKTPL